MFSEPNMACPNCGVQYTLEQAAAHGMSCSTCGTHLVQIDTRWITQQDGPNQISLLADSPSLENHVAELFLPAHNEVDEEAVGQLISSLPLPLSLEFYGAGDRRVMLIRGHIDNLRFLAGKIQSLWPSAVLRILEEDPVSNHTSTDSQITRYEFAFTLKEPGYLPIRTWTTFLRGDPVHQILATTLNLKPHERIWFQVLIGRKGEPSWLSNVQRRLKLEEQRGFTVDESGLIATQTPTFGHVPLPTSLSWANGIVYIVVLIYAFIMAVLAVQGKWLPCIFFSILGVAVSGLLWRFFSKNDDPWRSANLSLVRQKVTYQDAFYQAVIRASVWAKTPEEGRWLAKRLDSVISQYSLSGGNGFFIALDPFEGIGPWPVHLTAQEDLWMWLSPDEIAGLWHPPIVNDQVSPGYVPIRGVEIRSPDPDDVSGFYKIGKYFTADGSEKPVHISSTAMKHNMFCIGKPDAGKSTLMLHLSRAAMQDEENPAVILIDPHGDLVNEFIGTLNNEDIDRIRIFDITDKEYAYTINPLDVQREGWGVIEVTNSIVDIGQSLWTKYWGPRMQIPLKRGVQFLTAANELRPRDTCLGLSQLTSVLNADNDVRKEFIARDLEGSPHRKTLAKYFLHDYEDLTRNFREQVIQPVLSKAHRFEEEPMLPLFSCPESKLDIGDIVRNRNVLVINTGKNKYGAEVSDFVGSLIINVILMELVRQGEKTPRNRVPVVIVIDEFQTFTGVAWEDLVQQMRKYGGRMILGTQSMASLRKQTPEIPEIILSGVYSLFAFTMNGDDAEYISKKELSGEKGGPTPDTLISLETHKAYVRLEREAGGLSRPFYFESEPPPEYDEIIARRIQELRAGYSFPYEVAMERALGMLSFFDKYGAVVNTIGAQSSRTPATASSPSSHAASVLLSGIDAGSNSDSLQQVDLPWDVGLESDPGASEPENIAEDILGKEIAEEEWDDFISGFEGPLSDQDNPGKEESMPKL